ncbi:MAG: class II glutamine amidotransferase [bacterium]|nr:class II glutamine amidotransferase [bacterium]
MCRLLGIISKKSTSSQSILEQFGKFASDNPDGWGIGWYEDNSPKIFKQPMSAKDAKSKFSQLAAAIKSKIIIAHLREGTGARLCRANSHPFKYKNWIFAHNGSVNREYLISCLKKKYKKKLKGDTDSEAYFYWIMQNIEESGEVIDGIEKAVKKTMERNHTGLNFLLSDGKDLYALRYSKRNKDYYSLHKRKLRNSNTILVCSEKLIPGNWQEIKVGNLLMVSSVLGTLEVSIIK